MSESGIERPTAVRAARKAHDDYYIERAEPPLAIHLHPDDVAAIARHYQGHWEPASTLFGVPLAPDEREVPGAPRAVGVEEQYRNRHRIPLPGTCSADLGRQFDRIENAPRSVYGLRVDILEMDPEPWTVNADPLTLTAYLVRDLRREQLFHSLYPEYGRWLWEAWCDRDGYICPSWTLRWVDAPGAGMLPPFNEPIDRSTL